MQKLETITIKEYLNQKGIEYKEANSEIITKCFFNNCDQDSREKEGHLYFSIETSQFHCKKCNEQGNIITLAKHLGDDIKDIATNNFITPKKIIKKSTQAPEVDPALAKQYHQALPDNIRQYLNDRGIADDLISQFKLGWGKFGNQWWVTIPIFDINGKLLFFKLRKNPDDDNSELPKYKFYPTGNKATIYGWEILKNNDDFVVICEGEFDSLILLSQGIPAITSTAGAKTFKDDWIDNLKNLKKIYVCFDNDKEGEDGAEQLIKKLSEKFEDKELLKITLPNRVGNKGDITDYFTKHDGDVDDLMCNCAKKINSKQINRIVPIKKEYTKMNFDDWQKVINDNFPELLFSAEISLSIISQILIKEISNPFALVLVDVPAAGKTITINFFAEIPELTYATDKFTPASFVSNATNVPKDKLKDIDLLPRLRYKMFLIRDLATLFSKRADDLNECLGILTRVLDGEGLNTDSGVHGQRQYVGEFLFMMLAGTTPIPPKVWKMMGNLGSRLFFLNINSKEKSEQELVNQLTTSTYKEKENKCRLATKNFLYTLWGQYPDGIDWNKTLDSNEHKTIVARCAKLLAKLRGVINLWKEKTNESIEYSYSTPVVEQPNRINQLFYNLCRGHALVCGRNQINDDDLRLIVELAIDSAPPVRAKLFRALINKDGEMTTSQVENVLCCSKPTALKEMETLKVLNVCYIKQNNTGLAGGAEKIICLSGDFQWFLSDECKKLRKIPITPKQDTMSDLLN